MRERKLEPDLYNSIKVKDLQPNEFLRIFLEKYNKANVRDVKWAGGEFKSYSINCKHNGKEVYCQITGKIAKDLEGFPIGTSVRIMAMADSRIKGGKSYFVIEDEAPAASSSIPKDLLDAFKNTLEFMQESKKKFSDFSYETIIYTFTQYPYHFDTSEEYISESFIYGQFWRYCLDRNCY